MEIALLKTPAGFIAADAATGEFVGKLKTGELIHADFKKVRNAKFHRKLFALLNLGYEYWIPGEVSSKHGKPEKNFDQFRKDLIILAGYYTVNIRLDGSTRIEAKSISFSNMDDTEFENLYNSVLNVILKRIDVLNAMTPEQVNSLVDRVLAFG